MGTKIEQEAERADELAAIEAELRALERRARKADAETAAYLIEIAADQIKAARQSL